MTRAAYRSKYVKSVLILIRKWKRRHSENST